MMPYVVFSQIQVKSVEVAAMDITASTQKRVDLNGKSCALLKVEMSSPQAVFQGNIIGDVAYNPGEYMVYVSPGTKMVKLMHPDQTPITINFSDYGIPELKGETTYIVHVLISSNTKIVDVQELLDTGFEAYFSNNYDVALNYFEKASNYNSPQSMFMLSLMYDNGYGVDKNSLEALKWCVKAADLGYPGAQYNLAVKYFEGDGVRKDMKKGVELFTKAAMQGEANSMHNLGISYEFGYGVDVNLYEAEYWYYKAIENDNDSSEDLDRVREKIEIPPSKYVSFSLFCVRCGNTYCFSTDVWQCIEDSIKNYYEPIGIFMNEENAPFIITLRDNDRELKFDEALEKYGNGIMTVRQAEIIERNALAINEAFNKFNKVRAQALSGLYWISTGDEQLKGLYFVEDGCVSLNIAPSSVGAVRPIYTVEM